MLIDSHCHLDYEPVYSDLKNFIKKAYDNNVKTFLTIGTNLKSSYKVDEITKEYSNVYGSVGIHPNSDNREILNLDQLLAIKKNNKKIIAFGETGLDYVKNKMSKSEQIDLFEKHIIFAIQEEVPIIVHTRAAEEDTLRIIKKYCTQANFLMHCFTGNKDILAKCLDMNCYISYSGIVTFKSSYDIQESAKLTPINRMLIETDSPYLSPEPLRGKSNHPANIKIIFNYLANLRGEPQNDFENNLEINFKNFFFNGKN